MEVDLYILEADASTRARLEAYLRNRGLTILGFSNGADALEALEDAVPKVMLVELLLPGIDGFDVCTKIRDRRIEVPLVCTSALSWGVTDLPGLVAERFGAGFLKKPFTVNQLWDAIAPHVGAEGTHGIPPPPAAPPQGEPLTLEDQPSSSQGLDISLEEPEVGVEDQKRAKKLTEEFEREVASVPLNDGGVSRKQVRIEHEFSVQFESLGQLVTQYTHNISSGGLFVRTDLLPDIGEVIELTLDLPHIERQIEVSAKVIRQVSPEEADAIGGHTGVGVEFVDLAKEDRKLLEGLVGDLRSLSASEQERSAPGNLIVVALGFDSPVLKNPSFLHRKNVEVLSFFALEDAEDFLALHAVNLCIVDEALIFDDGTAREYFEKLGELLGTSTERILVSDRKDYGGLIAEGLCDLIVSRDEAEEKLLHEISKRLGVASRRSTRIAHRCPVHMEGESPAQMINISVGGVLLRTSASIPVDANLQLTFELPDSPPVICHGRAVRSHRNPGAREGMIGVQFIDFEEGAQDAIRKFVQSKIEFDEYFGWMKRSIFGGDGGDSGPKKNIFGLG